MKKVKNPQSCTFHASLWDGRDHLPGLIDVRQDGLEFIPNSFTESHLGLFILYSSIRSIETFLLFGLTNQGVRICSKDGRIDSFVLEAAIDLKHQLNARVQA